MEKLTISFWIFGPFDTGNGVFHDCDARMKELRERGFNCVRMESCAGLLNAPDGTPRGDVWLSAPFGRFSAHGRTLNTDPWNGYCNVRERLVAMVRAAKNNGVKVILSSWYYLHTNWFFDESINAELFDMPTEEKIAYFGRELGAALSLLRENGLLDAVAFAELFNEVDGMPFAGTYKANLPYEEVTHVRGLQEKAIAALKTDFPEVLFAFDAGTPFCQEELIPRNADLFSYSCYYLWAVYSLLENECINAELSEPVYPPEALRWMKPESERITVADVLAARGVQRTCPDWNRRCAFFENLDPATFPALETALEEALIQNQDKYFANLEKDARRAIYLRDKILPGKPIVMVEGATYIFGVDVNFEEHSRTFWDIIARQMQYLKDLGFWGAICRTNNGPEDPSWYTNAEDYRRVNAIFLSD